MKLTEEQKSMLKAPAEEQVKLYFNTIHAKDQKGGAFVFHAENDKGYNYVRNFDSSLKTVTTLLKNNQDFSVFCSLNSYKPKKGATKDELSHIRSKKNLWGIECIMIDIDAPSEFSGREEELYDVLSWHWGNKGFLPEPNLVSFSGGGGIHLYFAFDRLPKDMEKSINLLKYALAELFVQLEAAHMFPVAEKEMKKGTTEIIAYKVDLNVLDTQRMDRIPGSINPKTGKMHRCFSTGREKYTYKELKDFLLEGEKYKYENKLKELKNSIKELRTGLKSVPEKHYRSVENKEIRERKLGEKRVERLLSLSKKTNKSFEGCRELAAFILTNSAHTANYSDEKIIELLDELNNCFYSPLSEKELHLALEHSNKEYRFKNEKIAEMLNLTPAEAKIMFPDNTRPGDRKERTKRDKIIIAKKTLKGKSYPEIAKETEYSLSLVKRRAREMKSDGNLVFFANGCRKGRVNRIVKNHIIQLLKQLYGKSEIDEKENTVFYFDEFGSFCTVLSFSIEGLVLFKLLEYAAVSRGRDAPDCLVRSKSDISRASAP